MCFEAAAIRSHRATLRQLGKGLFLPLSVVPVVVLVSLAGCDTPGAGDLGVENEGPSIAGEGDVADPNAELRDPEEEAHEETETENAPEIPGDPPDAVISKGRRRAPVSTVRPEGVDWGADRFDSDAGIRLVEEQRRLQGRIKTLDRQLRAFDTNPPSRTARDSDPRGRPEVLERRLDLERRMLKAQDRRVRRELRLLRSETGSTSTDRGSPGTSSQGLFGGSD
jgi:hypothetical protein